MTDYPPGTSPRMGSCPNRAGPMIAEWEVEYMTRWGGTGVRDIETVPDVDEQELEAWYVERNPHHSVIRLERKP